MEWSLRGSTVRMNELEMFLVLGSFHLRKIRIPEEHLIGLSRVKGPHFPQGNMRVYFQ